MSVFESTSTTANAGWTSEELSAAINGYEAYGFRVKQIRTAAEGTKPVNRVDFTYDGTAPAEDALVIAAPSEDAAPPGKHKIFKGMCFVSGKLHSLTLYR